LIFWAEWFRIRLMTMNRSRPPDRGISRQTFLRGGVAMLATGAVFGCPRAATDPAGVNIANLSDLTAVFLPAFTSPAVANAHFNTMSTPYGPGWTFTCADTDIAPWDSQDKAILAQLYQSGIIGTEVQWTFYLNLPTQKFLPDFFPGLLWEFHTKTSPGHNLQIDVTSTPQPCFRITRDAGAGAEPDKTYTDSLILDHWYHVMIQVKWSLGSDGYIRWFIDGRKWLDYSGATCFPDDGDPYLQFGYYSRTGAGTNYSQFGGITRVAL
jgi:polysaccharide lyase-like protein